MNLNTSDKVPRWHPRPAYHLKAPHGWMNDPCAPSYDAATSTYHIFYQWNPKSCDWGHICWGHFTSKDGVHWTHNGDKPVLEPSMRYDDKGIFTGCLHPTGPYGEPGQLTAIYSSIQSLPIHWTIPYTRNCAGIALATSVDGGRTWQKSPLNPILEGEPSNVSVTGFRDPYVAEWPAMDELRGQGPSLYGVVSGGVVDEGPDAFVYAIKPDNLTRWTYLGRLCDLPVALQRPTHWAGDFGVNWECVNFMTLESGSKSAKLDFLIMGTEGGRPREVQQDGTGDAGVSQLWMAGSLTRAKDCPKLKHEMNGVLDSSSFYAANSYEHPETGKRILWGWIKEEDLTLTRREHKGWTGYLSLPREIFLFETTGVIRTLSTPIDQIPCLQVTQDDSTSSKRFTVRTLGVRPLDSLNLLRTGKPRIWASISSQDTLRPLARVQSTSWELEAVINISEGCGQCFGFHILHNEDMSQRTSITFCPSSEIIEIDRRFSNREEDIKKGPVTGAFTLFVYGCDKTETVEELRLRIFVDGDVVEVFANDRFALSTTVYADASSCRGLTWFTDPDGDNRSDSIVARSVTLWEGLGNGDGGVQTKLSQPRL